MRTPMIVGALLVLAGGACAGSQADKVRDARMEQVDTRTKSDVKQADAEADARDQSIEQREKTADNNLEATNPPEKKADEKMVGVSADRLQYQSDAKMKLDKLAARLNAAQAKLAVLGSKAPVGLTDELTTASQEYKMLETDVRNLDRTPASNWESTTARIEKQMSSLDGRVGDLTDKIQDV